MGKFIKVLAFDAKSVCREFSIDFTTESKGEAEIYLVEAIAAQRIELWHTTNTQVGTYYDQVGFTYFQNGYISLFIALMASYIPKRTKACIMNVKMTVTLAIVSMAYKGIAQMIPMFETTFYVSDALGYVDSVSVGHDLEASNEYNPQFGEVDIATPFDSVLEVRAAHGLDYQGLQHDMVLSKRIIGGIETTGYVPGEDCYAGREPIILFITAAHKPVTVTWDPDAFDETWCTRGSMVSSHNAHLSIPAWPELDLYDESLHLVSRTKCITETNYFTDSLSWHGWAIAILQQVEGVGIDTVFGVMVTPLHQQSALAEWCGDGVVHNTAVINPVQLNAFPNPVSNTLFLDKTILKFMLYSVDGKVVKRGEQVSVIDMANLETGVYVLQVVESNMDILTLKLVKA